MDQQFHGTEGQLEEYALGRLSDSDLPAFEEHLLMCTACQERLEEVDAFSGALRDVYREESSRAVSKVPSETNPSPRAIWRKPSEWFEWLRVPRLAVACAGVAILIAGAAVFSGGGKNLSPTASLQLTAVRGDMPFVNQAREVDLTLMDAPDSGVHWQADVADGTGHIKWAGKTSPAAAGVKIEIRKALAPGDYFVRLYGADGALRHEYGFRVRQ